MASYESWQQWFDAEEMRRKLRVMLEAYADNVLELCSAPRVLYGPPETITFHRWIREPNP